MGLLDAPSIPWLDLNQIGRERDSAMAYLQARKAENAKAQARLNTAMGIAEMGLQHQRGQRALDIQEDIAEQNKRAQQIDAASKLSDAEFKMAEAERKQEEAERKQRRDDTLKAIEIAGQPGGRENLMAFAQGIDAPMRELPGQQEMIPGGFLDELDPIAASIMRPPQESTIDPAIQKRLAEITPVPPGPALPEATTGSEDVGLGVGPGALEIMMGGKPVVIDPEASQRAKLAEGERNVQRFAERWQPLQMSDPDLYQMALNQVELGDDPAKVSGEIAKTLESRQAAEKSADRAMERARVMATMGIVAAKQRALIDKPATTEQAKMEGFLSDIESGIEVLRQSPPTPEEIVTYDRNERLLRAAEESPLIAAGVTKLLPKSVYEGISERGQVGLIAHAKIMEGIGRMHSGGVIGDEEARNFKRTYGLQGTDTPRMVQWKLDNMADGYLKVRREAIERGTVREGGAERRMVHPTLGAGILHDDGTFEVDD